MYVCVVSILAQLPRHVCALAHTRLAGGGGGIQRLLHPCGMGGAWWTGESPPRRDLCLDAGVVPCEHTASTHNLARDRARLSHCIREASQAWLKLGQNGYITYVYVFAVCATRQHTSPSAPPSPRSSWTRSQGACSSTRARPAAHPHTHPQPHPRQTETGANTKTYDAYTNYSST